MTAICALIVHVIYFFITLAKIRAPLAGKWGGKFVLGESLGLYLLFLVSVGVRH